MGSEKCARITGTTAGFVCLCICLVCCGLVGLIIWLVVRTVNSLNTHDCGGYGWNSYTSQYQKGCYGPFDGHYVDDELNETFLFTSTTQFQTRTYVYFDNCTLRYQLEEFMSDMCFVDFTDATHADVEECQDQCEDYYGKAYHGNREYFSVGVLWNPESSLCRCVMDREFSDATGGEKKRKAKRAGVWGHCLEYSADIGDENMVVFDNSSDATRNVQFYRSSVDCDNEW